MLRDLAMMHYQDVLNFQNVIRFHSTCANVILFTNKIKAGFPRADFHKTHKCSTARGANLFY